VVFLCPNQECQELFIAYYTDRINNAWRLWGCRPIESVPLEFSPFLDEISPFFCSIYSEAHKAEVFGLTQVCGMGYRKAFEFLIKDYLIKNRPNDANAIKSAMLGACINNYVTDTNTKNVAKRVTWLGNDETHYERRWVDKDLSDLKTMINLAIHWIEAEHATAELLKSMPG